VKRRQVLFTATARRHVLRERDWWVTNRENVDAFASDLDRALDTIATLPGSERAIRESRECAGSSWSVSPSTSTSHSMEIA
jgi:hypothetical protein